MVSRALPRPRCRAVQVEVNTPYNMRPEFVLNASVSYPQFIEVLTTCLAIKAATQSPIGKAGQQDSTVRCCLVCTAWW